MLLCTTGRYLCVRHWILLTVMQMRVHIYRRVICIICVSLKLDFSEYAYVTLMCTRNNLIIEYGDSNHHS